MSRGRPLRGGFGQNSKLAERDKPLQLEEQTLQECTCWQSLLLAQQRS